MKKILVFEDENTHTLSQYLRMYRMYREVGSVDTSITVDMAHVGKSDEINSEAVSSYDAIVVSSKGAYNIRAAVDAAKASGVSVIYDQTVHPDVVSPVTPLEELYGSERRGDLLYCARLADIITLGPGQVQPGQVLDASGKTFINAPTCEPFGSFDPEGYDIAKTNRDLARRRMFGAMDRSTLFMVIEPDDASGCAEVLKPFVKNMVDGYNGKLVVVGSANFVKMLYPDASDSIKHVPLAGMGPQYLVSCIAICDVIVTGIDRADYRKLYDDTQDRPELIVAGKFGIPNLVATEPVSAMMTIDTIMQDYRKHSVAAMAYVEKHHNLTETAKLIANAINSLNKNN